MGTDRSAYQDDDAYPNDDAHPNDDAYPNDDAHRNDESVQRRPSQERAHATQAAIIIAAATIFAERGYARTTLDHVANEAGVTKGALYFHFASKRDLANAVIAEQMRIVGESAAAIDARGVSALESVILLVRSFTERMLGEVIVAAGVKLITEELVADLDIGRPYDTWGRAYSDLFARAIAEGDIAAHHDPAILSRYLIGTYTGVQLVSNSLTQRADLVERVAQMWRLLLPGIVAEGRLDAVLALPALVD